jgi:hypothetical protein
VLWRGGEIEMDEESLRPIDDGESASTWDRFAKATGLDLAAVCLVATGARGASWLTLNSNIRPTNGAT